MREAAVATARSRYDDQQRGGAWLAGTRVVDLSNVIAGPTIGGMLARFGATVVKVDRSKPSYDGLVAVFMGVPINTGEPRQSSRSAGLGGECTNGTHSESACRWNSRQLACAT